MLGVGSHTDSDQTTPPRVSGKQLPRHVRMKARGGVARQQANISTTQEDRKKKNQLLHESSARKKEEDETCARVCMYVCVCMCLCMYAESD